MGRCGKSTKEAALTSYEEYLYLVEGKRSEASQNWQMVRWLGWWEEMLSPYMKAGHKHRTPQDLFLLDGEKKPVKGHLSGDLSNDTLQRLTAIYEDFYNRKTNS